MFDALLGLIYKWILLTLFRIARSIWRFFRLPIWQRHLIVCFAANYFVISICEKITDQVKQGRTDALTAKRTLEIAKWIKEKTRPLEVQTNAHLK